MIIRRSTQRGITLLEVIFLFAVLVLLVKLARPNFKRQRQFVERGICLANLQRIDAAKQQWAIQTRAPTNALVELTNLLPLLRWEELPRCPSGGDYEINRIGQPPTCDFGVSLGHTL